MAACRTTRNREARILTAAAILVLATRLPFLPATLEDLDSVNFDLGVHRFYPFADRGRTLREALTYSIRYVRRNGVSRSTLTATLRSRSSQKPTKETAPIYFPGASFFLGAILLFFSALIAYYVLRTEKKPANV